MRLKMNTFFGGTFIEKEKLKEAGVNYPIKLEYYKIINEEEFNKKGHEKYGIKIVKTEYNGNNAKIEDKTIKYLSSNEKKVDEILTILKENDVTPIAVQDIICDISKRTFLL